MNIWIILAILLGGGILILAFVGGGGYAIYLAQRNRKKAGESLNWSKAPGQVTISEVRSSTSTDSEGYDSTTYSARIEYDYEVLGKLHHGKQVGFGPVTGSSNPAGAEALVRKYPVGAAITAYYNPAKPEEAVLEQAALGGKGLTVIGIILVLVGVCAGCGLLAALVVNFRSM